VLSHAQFCITSPKEVSIVLYDELNLPYYGKEAAVRENESETVV